jgi:DNA-binding MarR family transcriptional regulator
MFREVARRVETTPEALRGRDRRWDISTKRAEAVALLVRDYGYSVSEVAKYLGRDKANIITMLSRLSARQSESSR